MIYFAELDVPHLGAINCVARQVVRVNHFVTSIAGNELLTINTFSGVMKMKKNVFTPGWNQWLGILLIFISKTVNSLYANILHPPAYSKK